MSTEDDKSKQKQKPPQISPKASPPASPKAPTQAIESRYSLPLLPLRDMVVFPHMVVPLFVGRDKSVGALKEADRYNGQILLVAQKDPSVNDPAQDDIYTMGVTAHILQMLKLPDGTIKLLVEGQKRGRIDSFTDKGDFIEADILELGDIEGDVEKMEGLAKSITHRFSTYAGLKKKLSAEIVVAVSNIDDISKRADVIAAHTAASIEERQDLLEAETISDRLEKIYMMIEKEISVLQLEKKIRGRVKNQMEKTQREYYLNEQLKAIQNELDDSDDGGNEISDFEKKIQETKLSKEARVKALAELKKLKQMNSMSAESTVVRNYLDWLLSIPWGQSEPLNLDLAKAQKILDEDHYSLEKIKDRITEHLAVQKRSKKSKGPILCFVGPPGVGKTSLGKSIARATGRQFVRMALGGVRDEAEIRGHRRTYIGSQPGRIIQSMKKVKYNNPLFLLDEVDKIGADFRGDPAAALLEVLDPEQNHAFSDHYLEVDYDLSDVMFITTANSLDIPPALLDRMEIIRLAGYTEDEKMEIAKRHLLPKTVSSHGLEDGEWQVDDEALRKIIRQYTREAGVRTFEREINALARKTVKKILTEKASQIHITPDNIPDMLGVAKYEEDEIEAEDKIGVVTGMAWTQHGGELLTIESVLTPGKGKTTITGNLRDVMKESIFAAQAFVRAHAPDFGLEPSLFERRDIHIHFPEGATPKDGPSAGVAIMAAIVSLTTNIPARRNVAMTGEITLRGRVLPIGGLKEKLLAAHRAGIEKVLIPKGNVKDLADIPQNIKGKINIVAIDHAQEIFDHVLTRKPHPIEWSDDKILPPANLPKDDGITAH